MASYIKPGSKTFIINDVFRDDDYFSSYLQNGIKLGIVVNFMQKKHDISKSLDSK